MYTFVLPVFNSTWKFRHRYSLFGPCSYKVGNFHLNFHGSANRPAISFYSFLQSITRKKSVDYAVPLAHMVFTFHCKRIKLSRKKPIHLHYLTSLIICCTYGEAGDCCYSASNYTIQCSPHIYHSMHCGPHA